MESDSNNSRFPEENDDRDRLSELPDQVLVHILSKMPITDAVKTVLLRRFGNLWTMLPSLDIDDNTILLGKYITETTNLGDDVEPSEVNACFTRFVRNLLLFHKRSNIDRFEFTIGELEWLDDDSLTSEDLLDEIKMWIKFAIEREVKELDLQFICCRVDDSILPRSLFVSQFLVKLALFGVNIYQLGHVHMPALKSLLLSSFDMSNEAFQKLISGCPSLQVLDIEDQFGLDHLRFTAPNIEVLHLYVNPCLLDCPNVKVLHLWLYDRLSPPKVVDVSSLREVVVWTLNSADQINKLVRMFYKVEVFRLHTDDMSLQLKDPDLPQTTWKRLHINSRLHNKEELLSICRLLKISPNLEILKFFEHHTYPLGHGDCSKLSLQLPLFVMMQLKVVIFCDYKISCQGLIQVVEFFLKSVASLEKMVIVPKKHELVASNEEVEFVKKLSGFARASSSVKVLFRSIEY